MKRYIPLDILRGLTVALMIVVNNPGSWSHIYPPLEHSPWDGCTPTDLVFPFFLFCSGLAMAFSLAKYAGLCRGALAKIFRRGILLFLLGIVIHTFPFNHLETIRVFGVLQRIALCYVLGSILVLWLKRPGKVWASIGILLAVYTAALLIFGEKGAQLTLEGNISGKIDVALCGPAHVYHGYGIDFDPEGLLGTLSATCNVLLGWLVGQYIRKKDGAPAAEKVSSILFFGLMSLAFSQIVSIWIPINKPIWSASYVFCSTGWACIVLGATMYLTDIKGCVKPFKPAIVFGSNAIAAYFLAEILSQVLDLVGWGHGHICDTPATSLLFALGFTAMIFCVTLILYKKKVFIKL